MEHLHQNTEDASPHVALPEFELFRNFDKITLKQILSTGHFYNIDDNEKLFNDSRSSSDAFVVLEGTLFTYTKSDLRLTFQNGDCINPGFLHCPKMSSPDIIAEGVAKVLCYKRSEILNFFREQPEKLFKLFTMNVIQCQQKMIINLISKPGSNLGKE